MDFTPPKEFRIPKVYTNSSKTNGFVYILEMGGYIKVGSATDVKKRVASYKNYPPFKTNILLIKEVEDRYFYERAIQYCLKNFQIKGEWFEIPNEWKSLNKGANDIYKYVNRQINLQVKIPQNII